ncbi:hypothetical protein U91I_00687 [alpha proteobacterium U9-1i]|nr:hypothetical protein U91I_00687 [alpha proteobacterium U9-1i]
MRTAACGPLSADARRAGLKEVQSPRLMGDFASSGARDLARADIPSVS